MSFDFNYGLILVDDTTLVQYNIMLDGPTSRSPGNGQEFEATVALGYPDGVPIALTITPVPEPTTMIAGALLLLPFGASTLRMLRKNRMA